MIGAVTKGLLNGGIGGRRHCRDCPNYSITENSQYTDKRLGDLRRLAVTQTPVKGHQ